MIVRYRDYKHIPGIYKWENKINHKCYIGQAIDINKRLASHFSAIRNNKYNNPLYKAIKKYGIDNFDVTIVEVLGVSTDLKQRLDEREKYYIQYFDSYKNGYNQTFGGDGGILGYKFTEVQRKHVSENNRAIQDEKRKIVYMYNLKNKYYQTWMSSDYAAMILSLNPATVRKACLNQIKVLLSEWICSYDKDELEIRKCTALNIGVRNYIIKYDRTGFKTKYTGTFIYNGNKYHGEVKGAAEYFGVSKSFIYGIVNKSRVSNTLLFIQD